MHWLRSGLLLCLCLFLIGGFAEPGASESIFIDIETTDETVEAMVLLESPPAVDNPDRLQHHAAQSQQALHQVAAITDGFSIHQSFWITNAALVEIDTEQFDAKLLAEVEGVKAVVEQTEFTTYETNLAEPTATETAYGLEQINAPEVWDEYGTQGEGTTVAVLDTGVDPDHPDIDLAEWAAFGPFGNPHDVEPTDFDDGGHGTHVSGTVAGGDASGEFIGVAPDVTLHHGAVLTACTDGCRGTGPQILGGMEWAVENEVDVISMSLGSEGYTDPYIDAIRNAKASGTVVVGAIGNNGEGTSGSPGNVYETLSVGATNQFESVPAFSGGEEITTAEAWENPPTAWPESYTVPAVSAPGSFVNSAMPGGGYGQKSGTSMATPHVAGAVALMQAATDATLTPAQIATALEQTARKPDSWSEPAGERDTRYGSGIIDLPAAVGHAATASAGPTFTVQSVNATESVAGESLTVSATIENTGDESGTQTVTLDVPALGTDNTTVTLEAGNETTVTLSIATQSDDAGEYNATVLTEDDSDTVVVELKSDGPPPIVGDDPPTDVTGDGLYEDINGDGNVTIADVQALFENLDNATLQANAEYFDFSGLDATRVTIFDVQALFNRFQELRPEPEPTVLADVPRTEVEPGEELTVTVAFTDIRRGVAAYDVDVTSNSTDATFDEEQVTFLHPVGVGGANVTDENRTLNLAVATFDNQLPPADRFDIANATLTIDEDAHPGTELELTTGIQTLTDEDNIGYETTHPTSVTLTVVETSSDTVSAPAMAAAL